MPAKSSTTQLKLLENDVILVIDQAEVLGLDVIASLLSQALWAVRDELGAAEQRSATTRIGD